MQGTQVQSLVGELRSHMPSPHATTTELARLNKRAHVPLTTESTHPGARVPQLERENLHAATREKPERSAAMKSPHTAMKKTSHASTKILRAATKTRCSQKKKKEERKFKK